MPARNANDDSGDRLRPKSKSVSPLLILGIALGLFAALGAVAFGLSRLIDWKGGAAAASQPAPTSPATPPSEEPPPTRVTPPVEEPAKIVIPSDWVVFEPAGGGFKVRLPKGGAAVSGALSIDQERVGGRVTGGRMHGMRYGDGNFFWVRVMDFQPGLSAEVRAALLDGYALRVREPWQTPTETSAVDWAGGRATQERMDGMGSIGVQRRLVTERAGYVVEILSSNRAKHGEVVPPLLAGFEVTKPKPVPVNDPYDRDWRTEPPGEERRALQATASDTADEIEKAGIVCTERSTSCSVDLEAKHFAADGTILPEILTLLRKAGTTRLSLGDCPIKDAGLLQLDKLRCLSSLQIYKRAEVTDAGFAGLKNLKSLNNISISNYIVLVAEFELGKITGAGFVHFAGLKKLSTVNFSGGGVTDAALADLAKVVSLEDIALAGNPITDAGVRHLAGLPKVKMLNLSGNAVSGTGFRDAAGLKTLSWLTLNSCPVTDPGLREIAKLPAVERLSLTGTKLTDASAAEWGAMAKLKTLDISGTAVAGKTLKALSALPALDMLDLQGIKLGDADMVALGGSPALTVLKLTTGKASPESIAKFKKAKPDAKVVEHDE